MFTARSAEYALRRCASAALIFLVATGVAQSAPLNIVDRPLFLDETQPPLNMLVLSRDHRLYYEAYNDASDLDGDGTIDVGYKPTRIDYYGYFESRQCYTYSGGTYGFVPAGPTGPNKTCNGSQWSGDWLNYMTTSRIDALRKVLYGGLRYIDSETDTVLQRSFIPQDAHSWGKEYTSTTVDGYDISHYTPLGQPSADSRHLFANTTLSNSTALSGFANPAINGVGPPLFRVLANRRGNRIWEWVSKEAPVAGNTIDNSRFGSGCGANQNIADYRVRSDLASCDTGTTGKGTLTDYIVRVRVCTADSYDPANTNCKVYSSSNAKPTGLLQDYGENDSMYFGLITGSYGNPHAGGVLRKPVTSVQDEINLGTGQFDYNQTGVIGTIDRLRVTGFGTYPNPWGSGTLDRIYACGWIPTSADQAGLCSMWGNPTAEMMYESLRYFAGSPSPTGVFRSGAVNAEETSLGLSAATWNASTNPYRPVSQGGFPRCSRPFQTVVSDIYPSFDSDQLPGSYFGTFTGDLAGLNVANLGQEIWNHEIGGSGTYFIGQSAALNDRAPTAKTVTSFGNIRGLAPEAPGKEGSYYSASVAYYGNQTDLNDAAGNQRVQTFAVALASPLPKISIPVGGRSITLVPFGKTVRWDSPANATQGAYQPTAQIVDFYVESLDATSGVFRVNFEDVEQGADHDMDVVVTYEYTVTGSNTVQVRATTNYSGAGYVLHIGYVISGSTEDGSYLVVRDCDQQGSCAGKTPQYGDDVEYFLDYPPGPDNLPLEHTRTFTVGSAAAAGYLKDPLWYAAKWGGFIDRNGNGIPDDTEWDADGDGNPDNYFLVTNALGLREQLSQAFESILNRSGSASSASVSSGSISDDTRIYQATFDARNWSGHLVAYPVGTGSGGTTEGDLGTPLWDAATQMPAPNARTILTVLPTPAGGTNGVLRSGVPFRWGPEIGAIRQAQLEPAADGLGEARLNYLRGDRSQEQPGGVFRQRDGVLGDIVNSTPVFVGAPPWRYPDSLEPSAPYSEWASAPARLNRQQVVYTGANDGMLHAFDAVTGIELFAYVPHGVFRNLHRLTDPAYSHLFYADGAPSVVDAYFGGAWHTMLVSGLNKGGQSIYALDVTNPGAIAEGSAASTVKWEFTDREDPDHDLGYTYSRPAIVKLQNGRWVAIFGNGYNNTDSAGGADQYVSTTGNAALYIVDISDGTLIRKINTFVGMAQDPLGSLSSRPNGLSTPAVIDSNGDGRSDTAYAGDLFGNLWKFDLSAANPADWGVAYGPAAAPLPLFVAVNGSGQHQPITGRPQIGRGPQGRGWVVLFGTGKFLEPGDRNPAGLGVQSFYGIFDAHTMNPSIDIVERSDLLQQTIVADLYSWTDGAGNEQTTPVRVTSANQLLSTHHGWYIDLVSPPPPNGSGFQGEMQVTNPVLRNGRAVFTTLIPDPDICSYGGRSWLMDMDAVSGARLSYTPFDLNNDMGYDQRDFVLVDGVLLPATGRGSDAILTAPAFLSGAQSDYAVVTSSGTDDENASTIGIDRSNAGPSGRGRQSWRQLR